MARTGLVIGPERLAAFIRDMLEAMGMPHAHAEITAGLMVRTDLRGVDSHGIGMLPRYVQWWREGYVAMDAAPALVRDELAVGLLDGRKGLGHVVSHEAMRMAMARARTYGVGLVTVRNSNHFGAAANYSMLALEHDLIGIATTNMPYLGAVPTFGRKAMLSTNPISFAAPAGRRAPFVLDMATTTVAIGKLHVASRWGRKIPLGWALDDEGQPTDDPDVALKHRLLTPLGGTREQGSHKGYGLAVMVDILSGVLPGAVHSDLFWRTDMQARRVHDAGHCLAAIDPARFRPLADFKRDMDDLLESLVASPRAEGQERIYVAGEPEAEMERQRRRDGIPVAPPLAQQCDDAAGALGVLPLTARA